MSIRAHGFQVFAKPVGAQCNLACAYCYYLPAASLARQGTSARMSDDLLETYIVQHIEACTDSVIRFSWHGGEPTLLGLDAFRMIVALQQKHRPVDKVIVNGIQTNGTLLDDQWCRFLDKENVTVGLSMDGPEALHDRHRVTRECKPTHAQVLRAYHCLREHSVATEILCVVNTDNVHCPEEVYGFFKQLDVRTLTFLPLVKAQADSETGASERSVPAEAWGEFLCTIFDQWQAHDIGRIKVQIFEEAARTAFNLEHSLCLFRKTCGGVPTLEKNGDLYSCDHFVTSAHRLGNIRETSLAAMLDSPTQHAFGQAKWDRLPRTCRQCDVLAMCHGGCPKNRITQTVEGESGLNYLCKGYYRFFTHCRPFVDALATVWHDQRDDQRPSLKM
jgi:uncharacterized protein